MSAPHPTLPRVCERVDYDQLERALVAARARFPDAQHVKALWTPAATTSNVVCEIWQDGRARMWPVPAETLR
jgi:hypothetical protein